jgi:hypothetical protein
MRLGVRVKITRVKIGDKMAKVRKLCLATENQRLLIL